jgi:hypothetical protein
MGDTLNCCQQTLYLCYRKNTYHSRIMDGVINTTVELLGDVSE